MKRARFRLLHYMAFARELGGAWLHVDRASSSVSSEVGDQELSTALRAGQRAIGIIASRLDEEIDSDLTIVQRGFSDLSTSEHHSGPEFLYDLQALLHSLAAAGRLIKPWYVRWCVPLLAAATVFAVGLGVGGFVLKQQCSPDGFRVTYYEGTDFDNRVHAWSMKSAMKDYLDKKPSWRMPRNGWSARWEGILHAPETAEYVFYAQSDEGVRLFIDDVLVIDYWDNVGWAPGKGGKMDLDAGGHSIRIEHFDSSGNAAVRVRWAGGGVPLNTIIGPPYVTKILP